MLPTVGRDNAYLLYENEESQNNGPESILIPMATSDDSARHDSVFMWEVWGYVENIVTIILRSLSDVSYSSNWIEYLNRTFLIPSCYRVWSYFVNSDSSNYIRKYQKPGIMFKVNPGTTLKEIARPNAALNAGSDFTFLPLMEDRWDEYSSQPPP